MAHTRPRRSMVVFSALILGMVLITAVPAGTATPAWSVAAGNRQSLIQLSAVSCVSATSCKAVGTQGNNSSISKTYIESWNGKRWSVTPSPGPKGSWLFGVSCVSTSSCHAVGWADNDTNALTERWNGQAWVRVANPLKGAVLASLNGVSCVSDDMCMAVGSEFTDSVGYGRTLIERWNGKTWSVVPSPSRGTSHSALIGVSCVSRRSCTAVGYNNGDASGDPSRTLIERWNGKVWSIVPSPNPAPNDFQLLRRVSCTSPSWCVAVGRYGTTPFIETWNGHLWTIVPSALEGPGNQLDGVSCVSPTSCQAVGYAGTKTVAESWNGHVWSIVPSPNPARAASFLTEISCASATSCAAVGNGNFIFSYG